MSERKLRPEDASMLRAALAAAISGEGPAVVLPPRPGEGFRLLVQEPAPDRVALIAYTSGSTGAARPVALPASALAASAAATAAHLGGPGSWLLALPTDHIAGVQVLLRSLRDGTMPFLSAPGSFTAERFSADVARMRSALPHSAPGTAGSSRRYTALVPTQIARILESSEACEHAAWFDAVLVGGASLHPRLAERARAAGLRIVRTYGMTETCGGLVYDGRPLPGVTVSVEETGRIVIDAPMVGAGYAELAEGPDGPAMTTVAPFPPTGPGRRRFRTSDLGRLDDGVLSVEGRADDLLISGGVNVSPALVEQTVLKLVPGVAEVLVTAVDDEEWGDQLVALVVWERGASRLGIEEARRLLRGHVEAGALPQRILAVERLPLRGIGKPDRRAARSLAARLAAGTMGTLTPPEQR